MVRESSNPIRGDGPPTYIKIVSNLQGTIRDALDRFGAKPRDDSTPLADSSGTDIERPRDIRGSLKVFKNVLFEHGRELTTVDRRLQPQSKKGVLTSVDMESLKERLRDAMGTEISASDLARACKVSPAAVSKWLDGRTKELKADNYVDAARALGVSAEWLRTGRLPRERTADVEGQQVDRVISILEDLRGPLAALTGAIDALSKVRAEPAKRKGARS